MTYAVVLTEYVVRQLKKLPPQAVVKLKAAIAALARDPRPYNHIKLTNVEAYRIRVGNYRVVYEVNDNRLTVTVVEVSALQGDVQKEVIAALEKTSAVFH